MNLKVNLVPYFFPFVKKLNYNSSSFKIIKAFFIAFLILNSIFISFYPNLALQILSPFLSIWGFVLLLRSDGKGYFYTGFFLGLLLFYWISFSSIYFNLAWIIPFEILGIGLFYAILFRLIYMLKFDFLRLSAVFALSFLHPLGFDWLNWGILTVYGSFDASYKGIICIFLIAYFYYEKYISRYYKIAIILFLFFLGTQYEDKQVHKLNLDYKLVNTNISQDQKLLAQKAGEYSDDIINEVFKAITQGKELIILPEAAFNFDLKTYFGGFYYEFLKELSKQITIIVGAQSEEDKKFYNSTYIFSNNEVFTMHKHYLVPFGEEMPFFKDFFRQYLLQGFSDFSRGEPLNQYDLNGQIITNALCYEATKEELYKHSKIIIALSNNAWFEPSSEPILQGLLIKFYASKYGVTVYHATNGGGSAVIEPKKSLFKKYILDNIPTFYKEIKDNNKSLIDGNLSLDENESLDENLSLELNQSKTEANESL